MAGEYSLAALAIPETLPQFHDLIARVGRENPDVAAEDLMMLETAVIELATNVVEHGTPPGGVTYAFTLVVHDDRLEALLSDSSDASPPETSSMPDDWSEDGRGMALAELALDELEHSRTDAGNVWRLVRRRGTAG